MTAHGEKVAFEVSTCCRINSPPAYPAALPAPTNS
jgi:hypothetical protein